MASNEDCGCNSEPVEVTPEQVDTIKDTLVNTKETLEKMLSTVEGMHFDVSKFDRLEQELKKATEFIYSGDFVNSMEKILERNANTSPINANMYQDYLNKKQTSFDNLFGNLNTPEDILAIQTALSQTPVFKPKTPIGYVYVDDSGEQKFSVTEPVGVTSTPVYGD